MNKFLIFFTVTSLFISVGCSQTYESSYDSSDYADEPENPYDDNSGHSAGFDWAESTGGDCSGNSESFNEGCEEYYQQLDAYESSN